MNNWCKGIISKRRETICSGLFSAIKDIKKSFGSQSKKNLHPSIPEIRQDVRLSMKSILEDLLLKHEECDDKRDSIDTFYREISIRVLYFLERHLNASDEELRSNLAINELIEEIRLEISHEIYHSNNDAVQDVMDLANSLVDNLTQSLNNQCTIPDNYIANIEACRLLGFSLKGYMHEIFCGKSLWLQDYKNKEVSESIELKIKQYLVEIDEYLFSCLGQRIEFFIQLVTQQTAPFLPFDVRKVNQKLTHSFSLLLVHHFPSFPPNINSNLCLFLGVDLNSKRESISPKSLFKAEQKWNVSSDDAKYFCLFSLFLIFKQEVGKFCPTASAELDSTSPETEIHLKKFVKSLYKLDSVTGKLSLINVTRHIATLDYMLAHYFNPSQLKQNETLNLRQSVPLSLEVINNVESYQRLIVISGWLSQADNPLKSWRGVLDYLTSMNQHVLVYYLHWDASAVKNIIKVENYAKFGKHQKIAKRTGKALANILQSGMLGTNISVSLLGFSLGTQVIVSCLQALSSEPRKTVKNVVLLGSAVSRNELTEAVLIPVAGSFKNVYSKQDKILNTLYYIHNQASATGSGKLPLSGVKNFDVSRLVSRHSNYRKKSQETLELIKFSC